MTESTGRNKLLERAEVERDVLKLVEIIKSSVREYTMDR